MTSLMSSSTGTMEIDSKDVVRLMLQFLEENHMDDSVKALQAESGVTLNTVPDLDNFITDIKTGKWDSVISQLAHVSLPKEKQAMLYEQIIVELLEGGERELAKEMVRSVEPLLYMKIEYPPRYQKLEYLCARPYFEVTDAYEVGTSKDSKRAELAELLSQEVTVVPPSRLLALIGQALRFQQSHGLIDQSTNTSASDNKGSNIKGFDLLRGGRRLIKKDSDEKYPSKLSGVIKFDLESHPETAVFSFDGYNLVTGSVDGFLEVWDFDNCKIRDDLEYQANDELMMHDDAVICIAFSKDSEYLASATISGNIKVWKLTTGACVRRFNAAHTQGITSLCFNRDGSQLLSTSYDNSIRLHGLKSGKTLKEFKGHTSYVNGAIFSRDGNMIISVSSDGTARLWDLKTTENVLTFRPDLQPGVSPGGSTLHSIIPVPGHAEHIIICPKSSCAYLLTIQGQLIRTFSSGKVTGGDFVAATLSPQGKWLYCAGEDGILYIFDVPLGRLESVLQISDAAEIIGLFHHPFRNLLGSIAADGQLKLWKP